MIDYIPWLYNIIKKTLNSKHTAKLKIKSQRYRNTNDINHTHMKKVGTLQNFLFGIYWWTLKNPKNENFEKMKAKRKIARNIILPRCTKSHNHMRYSSWDTELDRIFLSFWAILFPPPIPYQPRKPQFWKKKKASQNTIILNLCNKKHNHMMYAYSDMECDRQLSF